MRGGPSRIESDVTSSSERENAPFVSPPKASGFSRAFKGAKRALGFSVPEQNPFRENTPRIAPADTKNVANLLASGPYSRSAIRQAVAKGATRRRPTGPPTQFNSNYEDVNLLGSSRSGGRRTMKRNINKRKSRTQQKKHPRRKSRKVQH